MRVKNIEIIFCIVWLTGLFISVYLTYVSYFADACPIGMGCTKYLPVSGLIWFTATPFALKFRSIRIIWQIAGLGGIFILMALEFANSYFCPFCTAAHISGLIIIFLSMKM